MKKQMLFAIQHPLYVWNLFKTISKMVKENPSGIKKTDKISTIKQFSSDHHDEIIEKTRQSIVMDNFKRRK